MAGNRDLNGTWLTKPTRCAHARSATPRRRSTKTTKKISAEPAMRTRSRRWGTKMECAGIGAACGWVESNAVRARGVDRRSALIEWELVFKKAPSGFTLGCDGRDEGCMVGKTLCGGAAHYR